MKRKLFKKKRIKPKDIYLIVYDFDGIMTDNKVITFENGKEAIIANRADGLAVSMLKKMGIPQIIISTESNKVVEARAKKIGIPILYNVNDKKEALIKYCKENGYELKKVVYFGNDLNDLETMKIVGYPVAPSNATKEIRDIATFTLETKGGEGVIREFIDKVIKKL